jgi:hypothetical protein
MFLKLLGLQKKLDALFDEGWVSLGVALGLSGSSKTEPTTPLRYPGE